MFGAANSGIRLRPFPLTRHKVIAVEKGTLSVGMIAYARVLGALDCELAVVPAAMPTLEELGDLFG
jgi:hypothetical protein